MRAPTCAPGSPWSYSRSSSASSWWYSTWAVQWRCRAVRAAPIGLRSAAAGWPAEHAPSSEAPARGTRPWRVQQGGSAPHCTCTRPAAHLQVGGVEAAQAAHEEPAVDHLLCGGRWGGGQGMAGGLHTQPQRSALAGLRCSSAQQSSPSRPRTVQPGTAAAAAAAAAAAGPRLQRVQLGAGGRAVQVDPHPQAECVHWRAEAAAAGDGRGGSSSGGTVAQRMPLGRRSGRRAAARHSSSCCGCGQRARPLWGADNALLCCWHASRT